MQNKGVLGTNTQAATSELFFDLTFWTIGVAGVNCCEIGAQIVHILAKSNTI